MSSPRARAATAGSDDRSRARSCARARRIAEQRERRAADRAVAAAQEQVDGGEVRVDVRLLELEVGRVDERAHLLDDSRPEPAARRAKHERRALAQAAQLRDEVRRHDHGCRHATRLELALGLRTRHPHEIDLGRLLEPALDVEALVADDEQARERALLVDQRDARPLARVADDEPDDERDHERVGDERQRERRHPPERAQVLAEQQRDPSHADSSR